MKLNSKLYWTSILFEVNFLFNIIILPRMTLNGLAEVIWRWKNISTQIYL